MADEKDILKEVANIAAGHGSTALADILNRKIMLEVPLIDMIASGSLPKGLELGRMAVAVVSNISIGMKGQVIFLLDEVNAFKLIDLSYRIKSEGAAPNVFTEEGMSLIKEISSMVNGAFLNALSLMFNKMIVPGIPTLINGTVGDVLNMILPLYGKEGDGSYFIQLEFIEETEGIRGHFYLILAPETVKDIRIYCEGMVDGK